jgi:hypothetical protein
LREKGTRKKKEGRRVSGGYNPPAIDKIKDSGGSAR